MKNKWVTLLILMSLNLFPLSCQKQKVDKKVSLPEIKGFDVSDNHVSHKSSLQLISHLKTRHLNSAKYSGNHLYFVMYDSSESDMGKVVDMDLSNGKIMHSSESFRNLGWIKILPNYFQAFHGFYTSYLNPVSLKPYPFNDKLFNPVLQTENDSYWLKKPDESVFYNSIVCLDQNFKTRWQFPEVGVLIKNSSVYPYPEMIIKDGLVHCFFYEDKKIVHYGLERDSGKVSIRQELFQSIKTILFYPLENIIQHTLSPRWEEYEDITGNQDLVTYCYLTNNKIGIRTLKWNQQALEVVGEKKINIHLPKSKDSRQKVFLQNIFGKDNILFIPLLTEKSDNNALLREFQIFIYDTKEQKTLGKIDVPAGNNLYLDIILLSDGETWNNYKRIFLLFNPDFNGTKLFIDTNEVRDEIFVSSILRCFDINTMQTLWESKINPVKQELKYSYSRFWSLSADIYHKDKNIILPHYVSVFSENGVLIAKQDLIEAYNDFKTSMELYSNSFTYDIFPIDSNSAIITTCNGFIYRWTIENNK